MCKRERKKREGKEKVDNFEFRHGDCCTVGGDLEEPSGSTAVRCIVAVPYIVVVSVSVPTTVASGDQDGFGLFQESNLFWTERPGTQWQSTVSLSPLTLPTIYPVALS